VTEDALHFINGRWAIGPEIAEEMPLSGPESKGSHLPLHRERDLSGGLVDWGNEFHALSPPHATRCADLGYYDIGILPLNLKYYNNFSYL
jgi:hypothetical protein